MRGKLFSLSQALIDEQIQNEARVMIPLLASSGIIVTQEDIRTSIIKDRDQQILAVVEGNRPLAWARYRIEGERIFVTSIQLMRPGSAVLRSLLREASEALEENSAHEIESVVQSANRASQRFHERLGFRRLRENTNATRYSISVLELREKLRKFCR